MLQAILRFCSLEETLVVDAMSALARRRAARMDMEERTKQGAWGVLSDRLEDPPGKRNKGRGREGERGRERGRDRKRERKRDRRRPKEEKKGGGERER